MEQEEAQQKALEKEQSRIESGSVYWRLEQEHAHQNNINHTATSYFTRDSNDDFHPKNLADALRMDQETWQQQIWPLLQDELAQQGLEESVLATTWGERVLMTYFESCWLEDNAWACGAVSHPRKRVNCTCANVTCRATWGPSGKALMNVLGFFPLFSRWLLTKLLGKCRGKQVHPKIRTHGIFTSRMAQKAWRCMSSYYGVFALAMV
jgi:hypothetical protein